MKTEILRMDHVSMGEEHENHLEDFHLSVFAGELVNIIGLSASGKDGLWQYFSGNLPLLSGIVTLNHRPYENIKGSRESQKVLCIGRQSALISRLSVAENLFVVAPKRNHKWFIPSKSVRTQAKILLNEFAPDIRENMEVAQLTRAQCHIVELMRAITVEARVVVLDDVLQFYGQSDIVQLINAVNLLIQRKIAVIYVSHCQDFLTDMADRIIVLRGGRRVRTFYSEDYDRGLCRQLLLGGEEIAPRARTTTREDAVVFSMEHILHPPEISDVSLKLYRGEIVGLYDVENEANQCLAEIIAGNLLPEGGTMHLLGREYRPARLDDAIRSNVGYISRDIRYQSLVYPMSFADNLFLPVMRKTAKLKGVIDTTVLDYLSREYCEDMGIEERFKGLPVRRFDSYIQTDILFQRWLLFRPALLVCVDPYSRADAIMQGIIFEKLHEMAAEGTTIVISSPDKNDLTPICDRILFVKEGAIGGVWERSVER